MVYKNGNMNFKKLNEELNKLILNEMTIHFGNNIENGKKVDVVKAINDVKQKEQGWAETNRTVKIKKLITSNDVRSKLAEKHLLGVTSILELPFSIVWGESDPKGHGIVHILSKHEKEFDTAKQQLMTLLQQGKIAQPDKKDPNRNFILLSRNYKFVLALTNDNGRWEVVLNSMFKR